MLRNVRNYFFVEEAKAGKSDVAVLIILALGLAFGGYAIYQMGGF